MKENDDTIISDMPNEVFPPAVSNQNDIFQIVKMFHMSQEEERAKNRRRNRQLLWLVGGSMGMLVLIVVLVGVFYARSVMSARDRANWRCEQLERLVLRAAARDSRILKDYEALNAAVPRPEPVAAPVPKKPAVASVPPSSVSSVASTELTPVPAQASEPDSSASKPISIPKSDPNAVVSISVPPAPQNPTRFKGYGTQGMILMTDRNIAIPWRAVVPE